MLGELARNRVANVLLREAEAGEILDAGQHWTQVLPIANGQPFVGDIVGVEFSDGLHGKLTSSNREVWITSDAGQTWQKQ